MFSVTKSTQTKCRLLFYLNFTLCLIGTSPSAPLTLSTKTEPSYLFAGHKTGRTECHLMCVAYPQSVNELHEISIRKSAMMPSISLRGGSATEEEYSLVEPSESSSLPIDREANGDVNLGDAPDSARELFDRAAIETAPEPPDSTKVRCYIHTNVSSH